jgi:hypothetical protein
VEHLWAEVFAEWQFWVAVIVLVCAVLFLPGTSGGRRGPP